MTCGRVALPGAMALVLALAAGCEDGGGGGVDAWDAYGSDTTGIAGLIWEGPVAEAPAGSTVAVTMRALDEGGMPVAGATLQAQVKRGGGTLAAAAAVTDAGGRATFAWTLGVAPVAQDLDVDWVGGTGFDGGAHLDATRTEPLAVAAFADVDGFMAANSLEGSTEDLAFTPDGTRLVLGVPGALVEVDSTGGMTTRALTGDPLGWILGLAYDSDGVLWGADAEGKALRRIDADGRVTTVPVALDAPGFAYPNDLAVLPGGLVAVADTCRGRVFVFRPDGTKVSEVAFDTRTEGGANGLAVDPAGDALWVTTENAALLCGDGADPLAVNGGLYRFALGADGALGTRTTVKADLAHYADGITFDAEGNLYVMVDRMDTSDGFALGESAVEVLPAGGDALRPFLRATDRALANAVFGTDAFGRGTMYLALVAIPLLVDPSMRGLARFDVGIGD